MLKLPSAIIPCLMPIIYRWAERQQNLILDRGIPLPENLIPTASRMGVLHPECIRLLRVDAIPFPKNSSLYALGQIGGLVSHATTGLTLQYGIFIREDHWLETRLVAHECVHTAQYERLGFRPFLKQYIKECLTMGYANSPLEREATEKSSEIR